MGSEFSKRLLSSWKHDSEKYAGNFSEVAIHPRWAEKAEIVEYVPRETVMLRPQANLEILDGHSSMKPWRRESSDVDVDGSFFRPWFLRRRSANGPEQNNIGNEPVQYT